jgi:four helix bundle protein
MPRSMQDLPMWRDAMELVHMVHLAASSIPEEQEELSLELRNGATSIPGLIARGFGMGNRRDFCECLAKADHEIVQLDQRILIAQGLGFFDEITADGLMGMTDRVGRRISKVLHQMRHPRLRSRT